MIELKILSDLARGIRPGPQASLVKLLASSLRQEIDLLAVELHDSAGLQLSVERPFPEASDGHAFPSPEAQVAAARYLNSRAWTVFGGTNEVQSNILAQSVLGL